MAAHKNLSLWRTAYPEKPLYPSLKDEIEVDVVIVGAGITGLTAAYLLKQSGCRVAVIEKDTVGGGTTGRTTGKVTSQHNLIYDTLINKHGEKNARAYGEAAEAAINKIESIIKKERIECDWQRDDNLVFTTDQSQVNRFEQGARAAGSLGLPASFVTATELPFPIKAAVKFSNQAKFHAQKYVLGLANAIDDDECYVFEKSNVLAIKEGKRCVVKTSEDGTVYAKDIIVATNVPTLPLAARIAFCVLEYPIESYVIAGKTNRQVKGMYISPDENHYSILPVTISGENLLLVGGEGHIAGARWSRASHIERLSAYAKKYFGIEEILYSWSDRDYLAYDDVPLIGKLYPWSKHLYAATAFHKWGLTNGTVAAMILHDLIIGKKNDWSATYKIQRLTPLTSMPEVASRYLFNR